MTLTRLPAGQLSDPVPAMASARWTYPAVGLIVGALVGLAFLGLSAIGVPPIVSAFLAVTLGLLITGALHEDGLADCADGFWGGASQKRKLEIMRDSRIGTYGTLALILSVTLRVTAIAALVAPFWSILGVAVLSRFVMVVAIEWMPSARSEGLGASAAEGDSAFGRAALLSLLGVASLAIAAGSGALVVILTMIVAAVLFARLAIRHIGGQTGDVLGGLQQITEIVGLVALSALAT